MLRFVHTAAETTTICLRWHRCRDMAHTSLVYGCIWPLVMRYKLLDCVSMCICWHATDLDSRCKIAYVPPAAGPDLFMTLT